MTLSSSVFDLRILLLFFWLLSCLRDTRKRVDFRHFIMSDVKIQTADTSRVTTDATEQKPNISSENAIPESESSGEDRVASKIDRIGRIEAVQTLWRIISWTPKRCRWDPESPPKFTLALNLLFGFVGHLFLRSYLSKLCKYAKNNFWK